MAVASGWFSEVLQRAQRLEQPIPPDAVPDNETVIELTYRFDFRNGVIFIQPDFQFITRPGDPIPFSEALVFGIQLGINF